MKLAQALAERAILQKQIDSLRQRLHTNSKVQEGEAPAEDPVALMAQLQDNCLALEQLMTRINLTNANTLADGEPLTAKLARRDCLRLKINILRDFAAAAAASATVVRGTRTEIKIKSTVPVAPLQKHIDDLGKDLRELDARIQELNWTTDLQ